MSTFHAYVDAAHFHEALGNVLRFAAKRSRLPILEEAQVRFEDGHCVLTCTNLPSAMSSAESRSPIMRMNRIVRSMFCATRCWTGFMLCAGNMNPEEG